MVEFGLHHGKDVCSYMRNLMLRAGVKGQFYREVPSEGFSKDPLSESNYSPVRGLIHRYPDRVVATVTNRCFAYCRFCFRKRNWSSFPGFDFAGAVRYVSSHRGIREVLISGGDPLILSDAELIGILKALSSIGHVSFLRVGTRALTVNPFRITEEFVSQVIDLPKVVWFAVHVNHADEITSEFEKSSTLLLRHGVPVVSQTVLLKGINDNTVVLENLFCKLVSIGIKPYYLFNCDMADGNECFRVKLEDALSIVERLRGRLSGLCVPSFSFDLDNGGGKIVLEPDRFVEKNGCVYKFRNFEGKVYEYRDV